MDLQEVANRSNDISITVKVVTAELSLLMWKREKSKGSE